jgi:hypothetical protein
VRVTRSNLDKEVKISLFYRAPGLKLVVQTLLSSLKPIGNIVLICCTFFIIFGILGVQVSHSQITGRVIDPPNFSPIRKKNVL